MSNGLGCHRDESYRESPWCLSEPGGTNQPHCYAVARAGVDAVEPGTLVHRLTTRDHAAVCAPGRLFTRDAVTRIHAWHAILFSAASRALRTTNCARPQTSVVRRGEQEEASSRQLMRIARLGLARQRPTRKSRCDV